MPSPLACSIELPLCRAPLFLAGLLAIFANGLPHVRECIPADAFGGSHFVFLNSSGSLVYPLDPPLVSMLRTDRFGKPGFDDSLKKRALEGLEGTASGFNLVAAS